ncbi:hypothetical protein DRP77_05750 [Candidatus Poribacteria bacterium]|nr:MAG: hypothetical protein DRP77_05750 [Candidatus Poribacteria bacterium]
MRTRAKVGAGERKTTLTIRITVEEKRALIQEAQRRGTTVTELIRKALREASILKEPSPQEWPKPRPIGIGDFKREELYG